jgi:hypothetical protein
MYNHRIVDVLLSSRADMFDATKVHCSGPNFASHYVELALCKVPLLAGDGEFMRCDSETSVVEVHIHFTTAVADATNVDESWMDDLITWQVKQEAVQG